MKLNSEHVPPQFRHLIPFAEEWGINDDGYRTNKIRSATKEEIEQLKAVVLPVVDKLYLEWLGDVRRIETEQENAYIAFTAMVLAAEES